MEMVVFSTFSSIFDAIIFYSDVILHLAKLQAIVLWLPF